MNNFLSLIISFLVSAAALPAVQMVPLTVLKDGISLEVAHTATDGKNLLKCTLTNGSEFPMCSGCYLWKNLFYAKLTDQDGVELPPFEEGSGFFSVKTLKWIGAG